MRPAITSVSASTGPLKGTCCALMPAATRNFSAARCEAAPIPAEAKFNSPGLALAAAIRSAAVLKPLDGAATSTLGEMPTALTGMKSLSVS